MADEETKQISKTEALSIVTEVTEALGKEQEAYAEYEAQRKETSVVLNEARKSLDGVIFETKNGDFVYLAFVKGGKITFRKCLPKQIEKAKAEGRLFVKVAKDLVSVSA